VAPSVAILRERVMIMSGNSLSKDELVRLRPTAGVPAIASPSVRSFGTS